LGLAVAGIMSGFTTLILDYFKGSELNRFLGLQGAFIGLGGMVFLLLAGFLAEANWHYPFLIHLFAFLILPGVIFAIDEPQVTAVELSTTAEKTAFPWRKLAPVYITAFSGMVVFFIFPVQIPFYLSAAGEISSSQVGLALSLQTLSSVFFALQYQRLKSHLSFQAIFAIAFLAFSLNHMIVSLSPAYTVVILGLIIGGIGIGLFPPNNSGWLATLTPAELRGKVVGGLTSALFLGQFFSPIIAQPLIEWVGLSSTFAVAAAAALVIAMLFTLSATKQRRSSNQAFESTIP
jgi:MFS family permease